ncbi:Prolyl tripeptidyl peptidase precursor [compost metagenome]
MRRFYRHLLVLVFLGFISLEIHAQSPSLVDLLKTPYLSSLAASSQNADVFFVLNKEGIRNVFMASAPDYKPKQLTQFNEDDGQEISNLSISKDGQWAVFVRGGDHGANSLAKPINPTSSVVAPKIALYSINLKTAVVKLLADGDFPTINPDSKTIAFIGKDQIWSVPIDGSSAAKILFYARGSSRALQWSPDGKKLAFASRRTTHSFIGIFEQGNKNIQWVSPSFYKDDFPNWSPDSKSIAFIRQAATGGEQDSITAKKHRPWAIMVSQLDGKQAQEIWSAPKTLMGSVPAWQGGFNLNWATSQQLIFLSYQDGWPHIYSIESSGKNFKQLTKGNFSVDQISLSNDGKQVLFSANTGVEKEDIDRKHIGLVSLASGTFQLLTKGNSIDSYPIFINGDKQLAFISSTAQRPPLPTVMDVSAKAQPKLIGKEWFDGFNYNQLVTPAHVSFKSEDGLQVYGQLFKPKNAKGKSPALVYIHGGPRRQMYLGWHFMDYYFYDYALNQYLASQGFTVLAINYRMGTGYGHAFQNPDRVGNLGAEEYLDILAAGKWLGQQKDVDAGKIGVFGGSYGGYLTAFALGKNSDIFKAGVDIHGVHNRERKPDGTIAPDMDLAVKLSWDSSPSKYVDTWKSPVLIIHGDDDQNVNFTQSLDLVNRLKDRKVEAEYLVVPDDTHHWMVFSNLLLVKQATADFLIKHLKK